MLWGGETNHSPTFWRHWLFCILVWLCAPVTRWYLATWKNERQIKWKCYFVTRNYGAHSMQRNQIVLMSRTGFEKLEIKAQIVLISKSQDHKRDCRENTLDKRKHAWDERGERVWEVQSVRRTRMRGTKGLLLPGNVYVGGTASFSHGLCTLCKKGSYH